MGGRHDRPSTSLSWAGLLVAVAAGCGGGGRASAPAGPGTGAGRTEPNATRGETDDQDVDEASAPAVAAVERAINQENAAIHACWAMGAAEDFHLEGEVVLAVVVGDGGAADKVEVVRDTTGNAVLIDCLKELWAAHSWPAAVFAPSDTVQLPPFRFGAPEAQYTVSSAHVPKRPLGSDGPAAASTAQVLLHPGNSGNGAAALTLLEMAPGMTVPRHRHTSAEVVLVLSGQGRMRGRRIRAGDAVYIAAGAAHELENDGKAPLVAVQLHAPAGPERRLLGGTDPGTTSVPPGEQTRGPPVRVTSVGRARAQAILAGKGVARIAFDVSSAGDSAASLVAVTLEPGAEVPRHVHDGSSEYVLLLEGGGTMVVDDEEIPVAAGDAIQIPSGIEHGFRAAAGARLKAVQFYVPAGPEQRVKGQKR